jgi:hypothetical protein
MVFPRALIFCVNICKDILQPYRSRTGVNDTGGHTCIFQIIIDRSGTGDNLATCVNETDYLFTKLFYAFKLLNNSGSTKYEKNLVLFHVHNLVNKTKKPRQED